MGILTLTTPYARQAATPDDRAAIAALLPDGAELIAAGVGRRWVLTLVVDGEQRARVKLSARALSLRQACEWVIKWRVPA